MEPMRGFKSARTRSSAHKEGISKKNEGKGEEENTVDTSTEGHSGSAYSGSLFRSRRGEESTIEVDQEAVIDDRREPEVRGGQRKKPNIL